MEKDSENIVDIKCENQKSSHSMTINFTWEKRIKIGYIFYYSYINPKTHHLENFTCFSLLNCLKKHKEKKICKQISKKFSKPKCEKWSATITI